jgi:hypothetical protein
MRAGTGLPGEAERLACVRVGVVFVANCCLGAGQRHQAEGGRALLAGLGGDAHRLTGHG